MELNQSPLYNSTELPLWEEEGLKEVAPDECCRTPVIDTKIIPLPVINNI